MHSNVLYHGGFKLEDSFRELRPVRTFKDCHYCALYLTNDLSLAQNYVKGPRSLYEVKVTLEPLHRLDRVRIPLSEAISFIKKYIRTRPDIKESIIDEVKEYANFNEILALYLINLISRPDVLTKRSSYNLSKFIAQYGVTHSTESTGRAGDSLIVAIFNPKVIQTVLKIPSSGVTEEMYTVASLT